MSPKAKRIAIALRYVPSMPDVLSFPMKVNANLQVKSSAPSSQCARKKNSRPVREQCAKCPVLMEDALLKWSTQNKPKWIVR